MDGKTYLTNKAFCPLPWSGFIYEPDGNIKNCIVSTCSLGNINNENINEILNGEKSKEIKSFMLANKKHENCSACYKLEENKKSLEIVSSRIYYLRELKETNLSLYDSIDNFDLKHIDVRWSNKCNFACVYCAPVYSSKWEQELGIQIQKPSQTTTKNLKKYIFDNIENFSNIYMAGGEPLLMKENEEFLNLLYEKNPTVTLRVNTNLSKTKTKVFELITKFANVHWTVSVESIEQEFEYMRFGSKWVDFLDNLNIIKNLNHKISFNMLWTMLNYKSIFNTVDFLNSIGFHNNSFIIGPVFEPNFLSVLNLPKSLKNQSLEILQHKISKKPGYLLEDSYKNLYNYINSDVQGSPKLFLEEISMLDNRRGTNFNLTFPELYAILQDERH
jgi:radical SAM protein with 4Fe4S-binding SPASM domain